MPLGSSSLRKVGTYLQATVQLGTWTPESRVFVSLFTDPYVNLSLENYIFKNTPPDTHKLVLYVNNPCVVIGRNQNPWRECNLPMMNSLNIPLVRRRSGGGAVVHDLGNVNFSIMTPRDEFTRDKHAQMIVDAMNELESVCEHPPLVTNSNDRIYDNVANDCEDTKSPLDLSDDVTGIFPALNGPKVKLEVNERFDIVTKHSKRKVSGSAYKIERQRAYHHGTMLLNSRLDTLGALLHRDISRLGIVEGRGVPSVKSPVANIGCDKDVFLSSVIRAFQNMYFNSENGGNDENSLVAIIGPEIDEARISVIEEAEHMKTWEWAFGQTPEFTHSITHPETDANVEFTVNKGLVTKVKGIMLPSHNNLEGQRYSYESLEPLIPDHLTWILRAIDGYPSEKMPGMTNPR